MAEVPATSALKATACRQPTASAGQMPSSDLSSSSGRAVSFGRGHNTMLQPVEKSMAAVAVGRGDGSSRWAD